MGELKAFLDSLGVVAKSPYAFVAYFGVIAAWVYITISRHQLNTLKALPEDERADVLKQKYPSFSKTTVSGKEFVELQKHKLLFWGFVVFVVVGMLLGTIAIVRPQNTKGEVRVMLTCPAEPSRVYSGYITVRSLDGKNTNFGEVHGGEAQIPLPYGDYKIQISNQIGTKDDQFTLSVPSLVLTYDCDDYRPKKAR